MTSINQINIENIMKLNGILLDAGSTIVDLTNWDDRLGSYSEGDWAVWSGTGAAYRWSTALRGGSGDWVRQECYETGSVFSSYCWFDGDEANDAALLAKGWTAALRSGSGEISYDGDSIKVTGDGSSGFDAAGPIKNPANITTGSSVWAAGEYALAGATSIYDFLPFNFRDGSYQVKFSYSSSNIRIVRSNAGTSPQVLQLLPNAEGQFVGSTFKHFAFHASPYAAGGTVGKIACWVDHSIEPYYFGSRALISDAGGAFIRGAYASDLNGSANPSHGCSFYAKNFTCGGNLNS